ncbi:MAG: acyl carrier protein [Clostridiales bacterium]|nr:acyl carrier protein [Clostridiales bacterium]
MDVFTKIAQAIAQRRGSDASQITPETRFDELQLDSLDVAELIMELEDEFSITIDMAQLGATVGDLVNLVNEARK